jgi:cell division septation protein DedD
MLLWLRFCNGKRIPVEQAQEFVRKGVSCDGQQLAANTSVSNPTNSTNNAANTTNVSNTNNTTTANNATTSATVTNRTNVAQATELNKVQGLLYTVQVGVYARPVTSDRLFNIIPLYVAVADNGYLRYSSGIYNNTDAANQARNYIVNVGIKDAFVVAYYNGKRISVAEAKQLEAQQGASVYASAASANTQPTRGNAPAAITNLNAATVVTPTNVATTTTAVETVKPQIVYKVQIGAFKEEVPLDKAKIFFNLSMKGPIANYVTDEKITIFTFGSFTDYEAANSSKNDMINEGLTDAFVVAYSNGNKITIEEAKRLNGK